MTDQQKLNKEILLKLIKATSQEEVADLITNHLFFKTCKCTFYGHTENNPGKLKAMSLNYGSFAAKSKPEGLLNEALSLVKV